MQKSKQIWVPVSFVDNIENTRKNLHAKFGVRKKKVEIVDMLNRNFDWEFFQNLSMDRKKGKKGGNGLFGDLGGW